MEKDFRMDKKHELIFGYDIRVSFNPVSKETIQTSRWELLEEQSCDCPECMKKLEIYKEAINHSDFTFTNLENFWPEHKYRLIVNERKYSYDIYFEESSLW